MYYNYALESTTIDRPASSRVGSVKRTTYTLYRNGTATASTVYPMVPGKHKPVVHVIHLWPETTKAKPNPDWLRRMFENYLADVR